MHGEEYREHIDALRQECIDLAVLYDNKPNWPADGTHLKKQVKAARRVQMQVKWHEIMRFYAIFAKREEEMEQAKAVGNTSEYRKLLNELALDSTEFIEATFGRNVNRICLTDVINFTKYKKSLET